MHKLLVVLPIFVLITDAGVIVNSDLEMRLAQEAYANGGNSIPKIDYFNYSMLNPIQDDDLHQYLHNLSLQLGTPTSPPPSDSKNLAFHFIVPVVMVTLGGLGMALRAGIQSVKETKQMAPTRLL